MHMLMRLHTHLLQKIGSTVWVGRNLCELARIHTLSDTLECGPGGVPGAGQATWNMWYHHASALPSSSELMQGRLLVLKSILLMACLCILLVLRSIAALGKEKVSLVYALLKKKNACFLKAKSPSCINCNIAR